MTIGQVRGNGLITRVVRAARLDPKLYREVATEPCGHQAFLVVFLAFFSQTVFLNITKLSGPPTDPSIIGPVFERAVVAGIFLALTVWPSWALALSFVASRFTNRRESPVQFGQIARAIGFGQAPALLILLITIVVTSFVVAENPESSVNGYRRGLLIATQAIHRLWVLVATLVAVREALRVSDARALGTIGLTALALTLTAWIVSGLISGLVFAVPKLGSSYLNFGVFMMQDFFQLAAEFGDFNIGEFNPGFPASLI